MKHYSGIDYEHFLDDIRDMYPFSVDEAVLVELIANALDAKTSLLDVRIDPDQHIFQLTDNGHGMDAKGFEIYHNFSTSFKRKGQGIGFAGLGAKLALKISDRIVTETRSKNFWGASEWKFERKRKGTQPVWYDLDERMLPHPGTRVTIHLKQRAHSLLKLEEVRGIVLAHYMPLLTLSDFYETLRLYRRLTVLINGELLEPPRLTAEKSKQYVLHRGRNRKPFALARFEYHSHPLPEEMQGIAVATFGKIIRRDWLRQYFKEMDRVTGIIEVPELVECLTTSKCDFRKEGAAGKKYYRFNKAAQEEFRRWLEEIQLLERKEASADKDTRRLQRLVNRIVGEIPDLQQFYGFRSDKVGLVHDAGGNLFGTNPDMALNPENERESSSEKEELIQSVANGLEDDSRGGRALEDGDDLAAIKRLRSVKFGPAIHYVESPDRADISWMEGDTVLINTAHPTYKKAIEKKVAEYHDLFAVALAMLREVPTAHEKLELLEKFMSGWGRM